ncbi:hypothetical protein JAAARDRAFT_200188 [Jaapia argillacea MUCL 33604]|uniref:Uncharacterized protein n=1 Tax=Jaapia argillacea MUCL 33604 TaxID=933084 RepID=A0A067P5X8_9AGAM|nr:hypothetical protein JAAARDRAFT_200188 [Jaapia argillacea MUCL 33604]
MDLRLVNPTTHLAKMRPLCIKILEKIIPPTEGDHLKTLAIQTYILLHPNGCLDEEIRACWVLGMRLELTLGNVVWGTACQGGLLQSKPSPAFDQIYTFFFSYNMPSDLNVLISWESISSVLSIEPFTHPDSIQYLQLPFWWDQPNLRDGVYELMMATGMSEVLMDWVIAGRVPDFLWQNGSCLLLGQNAFPWELKLMGFDVESQSDYSAEQLRYDSILVRAYGSHLHSSHFSQDDGWYHNECSLQDHEAPARNITQLVDTYKDLIESIDALDGEWQAHIKPSKKYRSGAEIFFYEDFAWTMI